MEPDMRRYEELLVVAASQELAVDEMRFLELAWEAHPNDRLHERILEMRAAVYDDIARASRKYKSAFSRFERRKLLLARAEERAEEAEERAERLEAKVAALSASNSELAREHAKKSQLVVRLLADKESRQKSRSRRLRSPARQSISMVPGPTRVPDSVLAVYASPEPDDASDAFRRDYAASSRLLCASLQCRADDEVVIMSGEAMVGLWGAMRSLLGPGDRVLCVSNGLFGTGFADMANRIAGVEVCLLEFPAGSSIAEEEVQAELDRFEPHLVTMVHCETPTGMLNPLGRVGRMVQASGALFLVDFVASAFGAPLSVFGDCIDVGLLGSQKVLSLSPDLAILTVSQRAWEKTQQVHYEGYDALLPFKQPMLKMPYSPNWRAVAALRARLAEIAEMGVDELIKRHSDASSLCLLTCVADLALDLVPMDSQRSSPTCTALYVPQGWTWEALDAATRERGLQLGGCYGDLKGKAFRIGHMGTQSDLSVVKRALDILAQVLQNPPK